SSGGSTRASSGTPGAAPGQGEIGVDPEVDAAGVDLPGELAPDHGEALPVLGPDRVQELLPAVAAGLPVGPDQGDRAGVLLGRPERAGEQLGDPGRVGPVLDREQVAGVVPGRRRQQRGPAGGRPRVEETGYLRHVYSRADRLYPYDLRC